MKRRAYAKRRDANELEVVGIFVDMGCAVLRLDVFDLLVLTPDRRVLMVEVKTENGRLTAKQDELILNGWPLHIVRTVEEAIALVEAREFEA